jgi:ankyrin repeat protein
MGRRGYFAAIAAVVIVSAAPVSAGPLHDAARSGDLDQIRKLLDSGGSIEDRDATKETPLISAALASHPEIVAELIKRGADVMARNDRGLTALHAAAYHGDIASAQALLGAGAAVNDADDKFKVTPLILASEENHVDVVEALLDHGANLEQQERHGYTALTRAGFKERWDAISVLLKRGGECQPKDKVGAWYDACTKRKADLAP